MRRITWTGLTITKLIACGALFAALGGVAFAATSSGFVDSSSHINACLPPRGGQVHVWHPGHSCTGGWQALQFPATAEVGPGGPKGATGATGPQGTAGPANPDATTVDGQTVTKLALKEATPGSSTTVQTLYSSGGLTILALCNSAGNASIEANGPASADSELTIAGVDNGATPFGSQTNTLGATTFASFGPGGSGQATFSYSASAGSVITGTIGYQGAPSFGAFNGCSFFGTVTSG
ncbi:MAG: hypothetical protein ACRDLP_18175 [Solirubrobacteraceae bacterium]